MTEDDAYDRAIRHAIALYDQLREANDAVLEHLRDRIFRPRLADEPEPERTPEEKKKDRRYGMAFRRRGRAVTAVLEALRELKAAQALLEKASE